MPDKPARLTIRLGDDARTWLKAEADKRGLDEAAFARMVIYERMNGNSPVRFTLPADEAVTSSTMRAPAPIEDLADEPRAEEIDIPPDQDGGDPSATLDALMQAGPSFFDELASRAAPQAEIATLARPPRSSPRTATRIAPRNGMQPNRGPGSLTRPVGVNAGIGRGNMQGDGSGNVLRDNMGHFGFAGTRSR